MENPVQSKGISHFDIGKYVSHTLSKNEACSFLQLLFPAKSVSENLRGPLQMIIWLCACLLQILKNQWWKYYENENQCQMSKKINKTVRILNQNILKQYFHNDFIFLVSSIF